MPPPEQKARARIDELLSKAGWVVQDRKEMNLSAGIGVAKKKIVAVCTTSHAGVQPRPMVFR
jgi:hypothetical protein